MTKGNMPPPPPPSLPDAKEVTVPVMSKARRDEKGRLPFKPPRIILNATEGWGKTTCLSHTPQCGIMMASGETGYETLLGKELVPDVPTVMIESHLEALAFLDDLANRDSIGYKTLCLDALGGFERLCHQHVCEREFNGDWGERGFTAYQKGYDIAIADWLQLLQRLERIRKRGVMIILAGHCQIRSFKNPVGEDFDRYTSDLHHKTWAVTHKWADAVLFGTFLTITDKNRDNRVRGIGGTERILYCERRDAYDAKNRYGMPAEIRIPNDRQQAWATISKEIYPKPVTKEIK